MSLREKISEQLNTALKNKNKALQEEITQLKQDKTEETSSKSVSDSIPKWVPKGKEMLFKMLKESLSEEENNNFQG